MNKLQKIAISIWLVTVALVLTSLSEDLYTQLAGTTYEATVTSATTSHPFGTTYYSTVCTLETTTRQFIVHGPYSAAGCSPGQLVVLKENTLTGQVRRWGDYDILAILYLGLSIFFGITGLLAHRFGMMPAWRTMMNKFLDQFQK